MTEIRSIGKDVTVTVIDERVCVDVSYAGPQGPRGSQLLSGNVDPSINIGLIGDQYINTLSGRLFGPKTESGWGPGTPLGNNDPIFFGQVYYQTIPSQIWNVGHSLSYIPNITIVDLNNNVIEADVKYIDESNITVTFSQPAVGVAYLS